MIRSAVGVVVLVALGAASLAAQRAPEPLSPELATANVAELERTAALGRAHERIGALARLAALEAHGDPKRALGRAREAVELARQEKDRRGEMSGRYLEGYVLRLLADYPEAVSAIEASIGIAAALGDERALADGYDLLGLTLARLGRRDDALGAHLDAYAIREQTGEKEGLAYSHNNLGNAYRLVEDYPRAIEHHQRAIALKQELGLRGSLAYSYENLGDVFRSQGEWQRALAEYDRARAIQLEIDDPAGLASILVGTGIVRQRCGEPAAAAELFGQALELWRGTGDAYGEAVARLNLGRADAAQARFDEARTSLESALAGFRGVGARPRTIETLEALSGLEAADGRPAAALSRLQEAFAVERSTLSSDITYRAATTRDLWRRSFELEKRRRERDTLAAIALIALATIGVAFHAYKGRRAAELEQRVRAEALERSLAETRTLRGLLPICAWCKRIRDDDGYWQQLEIYLRQHSDAEFTHGLCPECGERHLGAGEGRSEAPPSTPPSG